MKQVLSIQYLRAIAALGVVFFHALESSAHRFEVGAAGVDIFFIISGFIMASLMLNDGAGPGSFLWRRIVRIVPLYWAVTLAATAIALMKPAFFYRMDPSAENVLLSLAFLPHRSATGGVTPALWQGWTLEYEMFFYVLCTAALTLPAKHRLKRLAGLLFLLVGLGLALTPSDPMARVYTNALLLEFAAGIGLASLWRAHAFPKPWVGAALLSAGFALYALEQAGLLPASGVRLIDWGAPALMIVSGALSLEAHGQAPHSKAGLLLGDASYSLYLTHGFVVSAFLWYFSAASLWIRVPVCVVGAIAIAITTHVWVERPTMRALRALTRPRVA